MARHLIACCSVTLCALGATAPAAAAEWVSYRDAYRAMVVFEKYGGPKNQIQNHLQVAPLTSGVSLEGMQLTLAGKATQVNLPLDPLGRTSFPLLKAAYDDNATLVLDRRIGAFAVRPRVSLLPQADGVYEDATLRTACEQALGFARYVDASLRTRQCGGVRFVFAKRHPGSAAIAVRLHRPDGAGQPLALATGAAFPGDLDEAFPVVVYRFGGAERAQVISANIPLAIVPLFE
ncbi:hypothetical protein [Massilia haematophila]|uniref:DUF3108 domain-containing protein n=2 Tax=Massilia TaxID=149698 RepID=A0ABV7PF64_9BURK